MGEKLIKEKKESPDYVRMSLAAAMTLRLAGGRFFRNARLHCINLLVNYSGGCSARCSYCGLSKQRKGEYEEKSFIRVDWPLHKLSTVRERLQKYASWVERICISMITNRRSIRDTIKITRFLKEEVDLPISLLISPTIMGPETMMKFKEAGADMIGVAIDAVTEELFEEHRGRGVRGPHRWDRYWEVLEEAVEVFGRDMAGSHLIVGLGETEREMVTALQRVRDLGARTHLFSFYPEAGSKLQNRPPCDAGQYRRMQLARYLIDNDLSRLEKMKFDSDDRIIDQGLDPSALEELIQEGEAFRTSGCPGKTLEGACNRPFGDGPPSDIRSYPFRLNQRDVGKVRRQMARP